MTPPDIKTLGELKKHGFNGAVSVKDEIRKNLISLISLHNSPFQSVLGFEDTVIPDVERALLSRHNILFLGLRGQAKTRMAREMVHLLDEWKPYVAGSEVNDDPFAPLSGYARELIKEKGDDTPIAWLHRTERYGEKLATPDVSVADLIGDIDPIKAANQRLSFSDERALHYGIIPRSNRGIFVINELPDLQARIQVALFNILQEGDIQIRGFKLRMPLDILFVFTANPEDYTNRGSIVTPLKDRIESQIITHYPKTVDISRRITQQEANILAEQKELVEVPEICALLVEEIAMQARKSEFVDQKSGVSARLTISAFENLVSTAERRAYRNGGMKTIARITDFVGVIPSITGKVELVYEGEQEGAMNVAYRLLGLSIKEIFKQFFPEPDSFKKQPKDNKKNPPKPNPYQPIIDWFGSGNELLVLQDESDDDFRNSLYQVAGLYNVVKQYYSNAGDTMIGLYMELVLHGLAEYSLISKKVVDNSGYTFSDILGSMLDLNFTDDEDDDDDI